MSNKKTKMTHPDLKLEHPVEVNTSSFHIWEARGWKKVDEKKDGK